MSSMGFRMPYKTQKPFSPLTAWPKILNLSGDLRIPLTGGGCNSAVVDMVLLVPLLWSRSHHRISLLSCRSSMEDLPDHCRLAGHG